MTARAARLSATRREREQVTPLELFFDLVFVLALTQCTALMADVPTWQGIGQAMLNAVRQQIDPYLSAGNALIDDIIDPRETRPTIAKALKMARNKRVEKPKKRHGVMPV